MKDCLVKVGFDGGQGILKIGFTISEKTSVEEPSGRSKYADGVAPNSSKLSSVKRLIILGAVADVPENYAYVKQILDHLNMEAIEFAMADDIKMLRILVGKSSGSPKCGCPFCTSCSPYLEDGDLYSIEDIYRLHQSYVENGSNIGGISTTGFHYPGPAGFTGGVDAAGVTHAEKKTNH